MTKKALKFHRILLKLSGEVLLDRENGDSINPKTVAEMARKVEEIRKLGCEVAIVIGGGNIFRGATGTAIGVDRTSGDYMGMLATTINSLALRAAFERKGMPTRILSALEMPRIADLATSRNALAALENGEVVIFAGGTGNPFFSTDSGAALRAAEINADALLKATKVDGVYTADPMKDKSARRYKSLGYRTALDKNLKVMDASAFALCMDNDIPIVVFDFFSKDALKKIVSGGNAGTIVSNVPDKL